MCVCVCVCPLSCWGIAALQPTTTAALLSAFSADPVSSRHAITLSNETGEKLRQAASSKPTVPKSIKLVSLPPSPPLCVHGWFLWSFSLSVSLQFIPAFTQIGQYKCGSCVDECGGMGKDWKTVLLSLSNWSKNLAYVLMCALPPLCFSPCLSASLSNNCLSFSLSINPWCFCFFSLFLFSVLSCSGFQNSTNCC